MKKYFAKYLPVEGEIKDGDWLHNPYLNQTFQHNFYKDGIMRPILGSHKVKFFLCSRDTYYGEPPIGSYIDSRVSGHCITATKVIGEISPEATWVIENMEFSEEDVTPTEDIYEWEDKEGVDEQFAKFIIKDKRYISHSVNFRYSQKGEGDYVSFKVLIQPYKVKCPTCKTFR